MQIPNEILVEYAWLGKDEEYWCFYPENSKERKRQWQDREHAIRELEKEGWSVTTIYYEKGPEQQCCAYGMVRFLH